MKTPLNDLLGLDVPIVQAPMGNASGPHLAAAVSNAGALGMLALTWQEMEGVRRAVRATRDLTDRPFGVNVVLVWPQHERLAACLEEGVRVFSLSWGDPSPYVEALHEGGALVIQNVATAEEARRAVDAGVDIVVAQGWEAGGHVYSEVATLPLVPRIVDVVAPVPVVAAGGIADGRGLAAVLALGAAGAMVGTRFLASPEAAVHDVYRERLGQASETDTVRSLVFDVGWPNAPHRTLRNSTIRLWEEGGRAESGHRPGEFETIARLADGSPVARYTDFLPLAGMTGDVEALAMYAGQGVGLVHETRPAAEIVREIAAGAEQALRRLGPTT